jgi:hypothetical protein
MGGNKFIGNNELVHFHELIFLSFEDIYYFHVMGDV